MAAGVIPPMARPPKTFPWKRPASRGPSKPRNPLWLWLTAGAVALGALVVLLISLFPEAVASQKSKMALVERIGFTLLIGAAAITHARKNPGASLRYVAFWLGLAVVLLIGYNFYAKMGGL